MAYRIANRDTYPVELTLAEAADYLNVLVTHILLLCEGGEVGRVINTPTGPEWRIRRADLDAYIERQAGMHMQPGTPTA